MDKHGIDEILKKKGYTVNDGDVIEWLINRVYNQSLILSEILRHQLNLQHLIYYGKIDSKEVDKAHLTDLDRIADEAYKLKNELIGDLFLKSE